MFNYYLRLALRSLNRNIVLTTLMIAAIGVGIGAAMTVFTVLRTMSSDPIPAKSSQLFVPQIDNWGPEKHINSPAEADDLQDALSYRDANAFMQAHRGVRQTALYPVRFSVSPAESSAMPFAATGHAVYGDFFKMFDAPFRSGGAWSNTDDEGRTNVVVLGAKVADRLFPGRDAVGQTVSLDGRDYRVVGVLQSWHPSPRFYDVSDYDSGEPEDLYLPFSTAIDRQVITNGNNNCNDEPAPGWFGRLNSECIWIGFWVELPNAAAVRSFREYLHNYAAEQRASGRFHWTPRVELHDVRAWLVSEHVVPDELRVSSLVAFGFLLVCLVNSIGLMLAKFSGRAGELGVRRALGASKADIFLQCLVETALVGLLGGVLGLALTALGLWGERSIFDTNVAQAAHLNASMVFTTLGLAVLATICSGLYPTWRASRVQPAWQLKAQ